MSYKIGIRRKIALFTSLEILVIAIIGIGLGYLAGFTIMKKEIGSNFEKMALILSQQISEKIDDEMSFLRATFAGYSIIDVLKESNLRIKGMDPSSMRSFMVDMDSKWKSAGRDSELVKMYTDSISGAQLDKKCKISSYIAEILVSDKYGGLVAASGKTSDFYQADEAWWQEAYAGGKGKDFISDVELDESSGSLSIAFCMPVKDDDGSVIGVGKASIDVYDFFGFLKEIRIGRTGKVALINKDGFVIIKEGEVPLSRKIGDEECLNIMMSHDTGQLMPHGSGLEFGRRFRTFSLIKNSLLSSCGIDWRVVISQDAEEVFAPLYRLITYAFILTFILCALALPFSYYFGRMFILPIETLHAAAVHIGSGNLDQKVDIKTGDEIESLGAAFSEMAKATKEREQKILSSKIYNDSIISSMADALIVVDLDATIRSVNKMTLDLLGYSEEELIGKPVKKIFLEEEEEEEEEEELSRYFKKIISDGSSYNIGLTLVTKRGTPVPVNFSGTVMREGEKITGIVGLARDMRSIMIIIGDLAKAKKDSEERSEYLTRMQRALLHIMEDLKIARDDLHTSYAKLNNAQKELIQSEKEAALGRFSFGVSHEVKNPLAVILGGIEFLEDKLSASSDDIKANISLVKKSALRANSILESVLQYVRPSSLHIEAVGINELVDEVVPLFKLQTASIRTEFVTEYSSKKILVSVDRNRIHQVVFNMVKNAAEAMDGGGKVVISTYSAEGMGVIKVTDSGAGMSKETLSNIFEPFFTTKRPGKGTGLGLVVSKTIIDNHKGKLLIESEEGKGTSVKILLPLAQGDTSGGRGAPML